MTRLLWRYRQLRARRFGVGLAVLALCLRLAIPALTPEPIAAPSSSAADLVALYGEHALCVAAALGETPPDPGDGQKPPAHDHSLCCLFHANFGFPPPQAPPAPTRLALAGTVVSLPDATTPTPRLPTGAPRARGPPPAA
ncbi:MAG TPA: DUF2946 family protein [Stellaceae bacterium]|jgi:hypothetical protein